MIDARMKAYGPRKIARTCAVAIATFSPWISAHAQGAATGGTATPARPLPPGMKPPTVRYEDVAAQAGLTGVNVSGAERGKQYIVESTAPAWRYSITTMMVSPIFFLSMAAG